MLIKCKKLLIITFISIISFSVFSPFLSPLFFSNSKSIEGILTDEINNTHEFDKLRRSQPSSAYEWWDYDWDYRIPLNVSINDDPQQNNVPIELEVNFTDYLNDLGVYNSELNQSSISVVESPTTTSHVVYESQFDPNSYLYDPKKNAIGDVVWIISSITKSDPKQFFIYFNNNESTPQTINPKPKNIRAWHEGFEENYDIGDLLRIQPGQQDQDPNLRRVNNTIAARGNNSLEIWGNCWKVQNLSYPFPINSSMRVTAKMQIHDYYNPSPQYLHREISGIGFDDTDYNAPDASCSYEISGDQDWGIGTYRDQYVDSDPFYWYWYTFDLNTETSRTEFSSIIYIADDDGVEGTNDITDYDKPLFWDDISIWNQAVETRPNDIPVIEISETIEATSFNLKITCVDIDGFKVPDAEVEITNDTRSFLTQTKKTNEFGEVIFTNVSQGLKYQDRYNITVKYTQEGLGGVAQEEIVYFHKNYEILAESSILNARLNLWSIKFSVTDRDNQPIQSGYIELINGSDVVGNKTLDSLGQCNLKWINQSSYNYSIYYDYSKIEDEVEYYNEQLLIYNDTVYRNDPNTATFLSSGSLAINDVNFDTVTLLSGDRVKFEKIFQASDNRQISEFNMSVANVNDYITEFSIDIQVEGAWMEDIYTFTSTSVNDHSYFFNYTKEDDYKYHLEAIKLKLTKYNVSSNNGTMEFKYIHSTQVINQTKISTVTFNITDQEGGSSYLENAILRIHNRTDSPETDIPVAAITIKEDGSASFICFNNETTDWGYYTVLVYFAGDNRTFGNSTDFFINSETLGYNFTYNTTIKLSFRVQLNYEDYYTELNLLSSTPNDLSNNVYWGELIAFEIEFNATDPTLPLPETVSPTTISFDVVDLDYGALTETIDLRNNETSTGIFDFSLNTANFNLPAGANYFVHISATKSGYTSSSTYIKFTVNNRTTELTTSSSSIGVIWGNEITLDVYYEDSYNNPDLPITSATVKYKSIERPSINGTLNPTGSDGYYMLSLDSVEFPHYGEYDLQITAELANYSQQSLIIPLTIDPVNTRINGSLSVYQVIKLAVGIEKIFHFNYTLESTNYGLADATTTKCEWDKKDENGYVNETGTLGLSNLGSGLYQLDFDTELRKIGIYTLVITLGKANFIERSATLVIEVVSRDIGVSLSENFDDGVLTVYTGSPILFNLSLTDLAVNSALGGASVSMSYLGEIYTLSEAGKGIYTINTTNYVSLTSNDETNTTVGTITVTKANYTIETFTVTIIRANRRFDVTLEEQYENKIITVVSGNELSFTLTLNENESSYLEGASISIRFRGELYEDALIVDNGDGTYTITFQSYPDAFFVSGTYDMELIIEKDNYKTEIFSATIVVSMAEIFPGFPTFYFVLLVISIASIVGSLVVYRYIQLSRIPQFIKDVNKMKSIIKQRKVIPETVLYPSRSEVIYEKYSDKWKTLGLSLEDMLGIKIVRKKLLPELASKEGEPIIKPEELPTLYDKTEQNGGEE